MPVDLSRAIAHAERILQWQDNLVAKEMPPRWMWIFEESLSNWFEDLKSQREGPAPSSSDSTDSPSMMSNVHTDRFKN